MTMAATTNTIIAATAITSMWCMIYSGIASKRISRRLDKNRPANRPHIVAGVVNDTHRVAVARHHGEHMMSVRDTDRAGVTGRARKGVTMSAPVFKFMP